MTEQRTQKSSPFLESFGLLQILFHLQTLDGAIEGCFGANDVDVAFASMSEALFSALFGAGGAVEIDLIGGLCAWREDGDVVVIDFHEATADEDVAFFACGVFVAHDLWLESCDEGGVVRQEADLTLWSANDDALCFYG